MASQVTMKEECSSVDSVSGADDSFITPVSSVGDLMALSPSQNKQHSTSFEDDIRDDFLTGMEFDSICDVTMQEIPAHEDVFLDPDGINYLINCTNSGNRNIIDSGKESLYVKFDPLYAKNKDNTDKVALKEECSVDFDAGYETGSTVSTSTNSNVQTPKRSMSAIPSYTNCNKKPTQIVPPAVNRDYSNTPQMQNAPSLMRSLSAIITPTPVAIDRLISTTPPVPAPPHSPQYEHYNHQPNDRLHSLRIILQRQENEIHQLRQENRDLKYTLQDLENKLTRQTEDMTLKIIRLTEDRNDLIEKESKLSELLKEKSLSNKQMCVVMEEYEKTISRLINEEQTKSTRFNELQEKLVQEKQQALNHLSSMESSFNDLLVKYEKCKGIILEANEREQTLNQDISEFEQGIKKYESLYTTLKQVTSENLLKANDTLECVKKNHSVELTKCHATIKKHELTISSLQESLAQKTRNNEELTAICDELINKVQ